jgi:hypothetical protein
MIWILHLTQAIGFIEERLGNGLKELHNSLNLDE